MFTDVVIPIEARPLGTVSVVSRRELAQMPQWRECFADNRKDHRYYEIVEDTILHGFDYRYFVLSDEAGQVKAVQPFFILDQDLVAGTPQFLQRIVNTVRRLFRRFLFLRTLMVGCAAGEGHLAHDEPELAQWISRSLHASLRRQARVAGCSLIVCKEFPSEYRRAMNCFKDAGYARVPSLPMVKLDIAYANFDEYMAKALSHATRKNLRRKFKASAGAPPIDMQIVNDVTSCVDEVYPLYLQVYHRSKLNFEKLTREYLCQLGQRMPDKARFFIWRKNGKAVAFSICLVHGDTLYDEYLGLDYSIALDLHLYFCTIRDVLSWGMANGYRWYVSSSLGYDPKLHLKCDLAPLDLYVAHTSAVPNFFLRKLLPWLEPTRAEPTLRKFRNYSDLWDDRPPGAGHDLLTPDETAADGKTNGPRPTAGAYAQLAVGALLVTAAELLLKRGAAATLPNAAATGILGIAALKSRWTWMGVVAYILSFLNWISVLRRSPLSIAFTLMSVVYILVPLGAWVFLGERIPMARWLGIALIVAGVIAIVGKPAHRQERA